MFLIPADGIRLSGWMPDQGMCLVAEIIAGGYFLGFGFHYGTLPS